MVVQSQMDCKVVALLLKLGLLCFVYFLFIYFFSLVVKTYEHMVHMAKNFLRFAECRKQEGYGVLAPTRRFVKVERRVLLRLPSHLFHLPFEIFEFTFLFACNDLFEAGVVRVDSVEKTITKNDIKK